MIYGFLDTWIGFSLDSNASNGSKLKVRILVAKLS